MFFNVKKLVLFQLIFFYIFVGTGLIVNFLQLLTFIFLRPFSKCLYRSLNRCLACSFWSYITALAQYWSGCDCEIYMPDEDFKYVNKEHTIVIMNHKYDVDWLMGWIVCQRTGLLPGSKIIGKSSLRLVPLIGWCWIFSESIFIQRKWETDKRILIESLDSILLDYPKDCYFNILMFCEGTRFTKEKHEESMKVARDKGLPELKHHLLPRTKGFSLLAKGASNRSISLFNILSMTLLGIHFHFLFLIISAIQLKSYLLKVGAIYDLTVGIDPNGPKPDLNTIRGGVGLKGQLFVRRIPFSSVPQDEEKSAEFLHQLYKEKDEIYDTYAKTGSFDSLGVKKQVLKKNYLDLVMSVLWSILLLTPVVYMFYALFTQAPFLLIFSFLAFLIIASYCLELLIGVTRSESGSHYGINKTNKSN